MVGLRSLLTDCRRAFDQLRTKEQLGYVVFTGQLLQATTMGYRVLIQSERSCEYLESRIEAFLSGDWSMSEEDFEKHQQSLLTRLSESLKNLNQESNRLWWYIGSEIYDFLQIDNDIENVSKLTREDMAEFYNTYISPESKTRAKLSVHLKSIAKSSGAVPDLSATDHVIAALTQFLSSALSTSLSVDDVKAAFPSLNIKSPEHTSRQVHEFLTSKGAETAQADIIVQKGMTALQQLMPQLQALEADQKPSLDEMTTNGDKEAKTKKATIIEDVSEWRKGLMLSKGPRPVRDLTEMEETTMKL